ncbi:MAG: bifunctional phosphopantothenoylcysteine decarboxylase/phosphopantothenate--cysteine ligase CoaBC [Alphaproteobacteria bacterium]
MNVSRTQQFLAEIDTFLSETGTSASNLGRAAVGDPSLVSDLRERGRSPSADLMDRVSAFMAIHRDGAAGGSQAADHVDDRARDDAATVLLVIGGGIAAYKSLDLIRRLRERAVTVRPVMTMAAQNFITPLSVGALAGGRVYTDLFDRDDEHDVGHIRLARAADLIVVAPATADFMARMAGGHANDLATAIILAARCPLLLAPAMNPAMWSNPVTRRNVADLRALGVRFCGPEAGEMAESGEAGIGRMAEALSIAEAATAMLKPGARPLAGAHVVVSSGPTHEPIDPVRYLANRSSGRQGHAIAAAAAAAGARVTLVAGPVDLTDPPGVDVVHVETARDMLAAVTAALPADIAIMAAAVADWRTADSARSKIKKQKGEGPPALALVENPDILATIGHHKTQRPALVIGFAAETDDVLRHGEAKRGRKGADWILANDVSPGTGVMGGTENEVHLIGPEGVESWPRMAKSEVAARLVTRIVEHLKAASP